MTFTPTDFSEWSEQDVREGIIAKLLQQLGYEKGTNNDILRSEQLKLRYDREIFGRPKKTDRQLESFPDYILVVDRTWRWVIEAKPPSEEIGPKQIWQTYSYAKHHEVRAIMFCVCNGRALKIFRTDFSPEAALIKEFKYEELNSEFDTIANILSPDVIRRTWPKIEIDSGKPLGMGLGSFALIIGGTFKYEDINSSHPLMRNADVSFLQDVVFTITGGFVERSHDKLHVMVIVRSPSAEGQRISESIGIDRMELWSEATLISDNKNEPTIFSYAAEYTIPPARTGILGMQRYLNPIPCSVMTSLRIYLEGTTVKGNFEASMRLVAAGVTIPVTLRGTLVANVV